MKSNWSSSGRVADTKPVVDAINAMGGGGDGAILDGVSSAIKATVKDLTNSNPLTVAITDGNGDQITSFGGGTQYTEGDTDASITGTAVMWEDAANTLVPVSTTKPLPVSATIDTTGLALAANQLPDGHNVTVDNVSLPVTGPLTDTELRATPVPVSGTVAVTNAGLTALNGAIAGTEVQVDVLTMPTVAVTGTFYPATQPVSATDLDIRNLAKAQDEVYAVLKTDAGVAYDARSVTVQNATLAVTQSGTWDEVGINDSGNSITVDAPVGTPVFMRLSDGASAITTLPVSLASVPSHAVTNAGTFAVQETTYSSSSVTQVASSATSVQLLASTAGRRGAYFMNDSTAIAYLKLGTTSATNSYTVKMAAGAYYELPYPCYTGRIDCIWASANGVMAITELT